MSMHPSLESRIRAQERIQNDLDARVEELSSDMLVSYKHISEYLGKIEDQLTLIEKNMPAMEDRILKTIRDDIAAMEDRIQKDMAAMEGRILDAFKQLVAVVTAPPQ